MIQITLSKRALLSRKASAYAFFVDHSFDPAQLRKTVSTLYPAWEQALKERGFTGKAGSSLILTGTVKDKAVYLIFLGLGDLKSGYDNIETYRRAVGTLVRIAESHKFTSLTFDLPDPAVLSLSYERLAQETSTIMHKAAYHFDDYITSDDRKFRWQIKAVIGVSKKYSNVVQKGIDFGLCIADAINTARYWCDLPPSALTPPIFARQAEKLAKDYGLKAKIFGKKEITKMGMGGIEGVCRGSEHEPRLVVLEYKASAKAPTLCLVGKGVTFDSGGLSLKPPVSMETMKEDMSGAAIVLSAMKVIAQYKPKINVIAIAPMVENMPSGTALKPGDIIRTFNGKTIEVANTDAEGRLILADALAYAVTTYKPDAIIDLATLTGACAAALGPFYAGLFSQHDALTARVLKASEHSGDKVWRLPMDDDYKPAIRSDFADVRNIGSKRYMAGSITAAFFLQNFVGNKTPWVHLDIAGVAFGVPDLTYLRPGATGFGIRLLTDLVLHWDKDFKKAAQ